MPKPPITLELYTDGACRTSTKDGGWAYILIARKGQRVIKQLEASGHEPDTTNNVMEIWAVIEGLNALEHPVVPPQWLTVYTDSQYVAKAFNSGWLRAWKRNDWCRRDGKALVPIKNPEFWKILDRVAQPHNIEWQWVRGHAGNRWNERADALAVAASRGRTEAPQQKQTAQT